MILPNTCSFGMCFLTLLLMIMKMPISGGLNHQASFLPGWPIVLSSLVQPLSSLGNGFGNPGHRGNAKPSFGWPSTTIAGQLTDYKREDFHIQSIGPLCDQDDEPVQHLLTSCVFARQFWFSILQPLNLSALVPNRRCTSLSEWWKKSCRKIPK